MNPTLLSTLAWAAAVVVLAGCKAKPEGHTEAAQNLHLPTVAVRTQRVESQPWPSTEEVVGTVRAKLRATLEAKVSGHIAEMPAGLGQAVKAGQLLARLEAAEIQARLDQAQAGLQHAEREWKRVAALFRQQASTRSELDAAEAHHLVAKAAVAEAQAMAAYAEVRAPFDGVVSGKWAEVGDLASPGKALVELEDPTALQVEADVPEAIRPGIRPGTPMPLRVDAVPGELLATVSEMAPAADPTTRTFRVKLDLPGGSVLKSGQFARLLVLTGERASVRVPAAAVVQRGQMELVFVVKEQRAHLRLVRSGRRLGQEAEILSGLEAGDCLVVSGATQLLEGQPVEAQ